MPQHSTHFETIGGGLVLSDAILIYRTCGAGSGRPDDSAAFASVHAVEQDGEGAPTIAAGKPLTRAHLRQWTQALGRAAAPEILPDNVLISHPDILAWWVPEQVRTAFFALSSPPDGLCVLSKRISVRVPYPAHLFIATRVGLSVFALGTSERPTAETVLLHSPILNVFVDGKLCWGSIARPRGLTVGSIPEFESAVFDSWSTHPNPGQEMTVTGKGGLQKLWDDLAAREAKRFPVRCLKPFGTAGWRNAGRNNGPATAGPITLGHADRRERTVMSALAEDPTAAAVLDAIPCYPVPPHGRSPAIDALREAQVGRGLVVGADGVMLILRRPWLALDVPITEPLAASLPYGVTGGPRADLRCGLIPIDLLGYVLERFVAALPNESAAFILWNEGSGLFTLAWPIIDEATPSRLVYRPPSIAPGWHLVCDIHCHGTGPAFFSATDDADDAYATKIALVFGRLGHPDGTAMVSRICADGLFLPLPRSPFSGGPDVS